MSVVGVARWTPGAAHVRLAMLSLFGQGLGVGFLGILLSGEALFGTAAGYAGAAATAGALAAALPGHRFSSRAAAGRGTRAFLAVCGIVAACGLLAAEFVASIRMPGEILVFLLGLSTGGCLRVSLALVLPMLPARRSTSLLGLAGVSFGLGGLVASAVGIATVSAAAASSLPFWGASVPVVLAATAFRAGRLRVRHEEGGPPWEGVSHRTTPRSVLMAASFVVQAATCLMAACWLAVHLLRGVGLSGLSAATLLMVFWAALCTGWALARRVARHWDSLSSISVPLALGVPGSLFLMIGWHPGVGLGAALLGLGIGTLFALTLRLGHWPSALGRCRWILRSLHLALPAGLVLGWGTGSLAFAAGSGALVWAILGGFLVAVATVVLLVVDYRVSGDPALI